MFIFRYREPRIKFGWYLLIILVSIHYDFYWEKPKWQLEDCRQDLWLWSNFILNRFEIVFKDKDYKFLVKIHEFKMTTPRWWWRRTFVIIAQFCSKLVCWGWRSWFFLSNFTNWIWRFQHGDEFCDWLDDKILFKIGMRGFLDWSSAILIIPLIVPLGSVSNRLKILRSNKCRWIIFVF